MFLFRLYFLFILFISSLSIRTYTSASVLHRDRNSASQSTYSPSASFTYDILVYSANPAGLSTAISAAEHNSSLRIAILCATAEIGGMSVAGGIGMRDLGNEYAFVNTIGHQWTMLNAEHYKVNYPVYQPDMYIGEQSYYKLLNAFPNIQVYLYETLAEISNPVVMDNNVIKSITTINLLNGTLTMWNAYVFIDSSYEGDIILNSGITYTYGRESRQLYNESRAGVQPWTSFSNFPKATNATFPNGTYLPYVDSTDINKPGMADDRVMGYSFRLCVTNNKSNEAAFFPPPDYNPDDFILLQNAIDETTHNGTGPGFSNIVDVLDYRSYPPANKWDICDSTGFAFTSDAINLNRNYPGAGYAARQKAYNDTYYYVLGLVWYIASNPNVPNNTRSSLVDHYGLCKDQWIDHKHIPTQMYVREGIRVVGDHVTTEHDLVGGLCKNNTLALGSWGYDIHVVSRIVYNDPNKSPYSIVSNEGQIVGGIAGKGDLYELEYSVILPKMSEVKNLQVPTVTSSSHVAFSSIRVEPTYIVLGEAGGLAAALCVNTGCIENPLGLLSVNITMVQSLMEKRGINLHAPAGCNTTENNNY